MLIQTIQNSKKPNKQNNKSIRLPQREYDNVKSSYYRQGCDDVCGVAKSELRECIMS